MNSSPTFALDPDTLNDLALRYRETFARAKPFSHIVIDNFLPEAIVDAVLAEFPSPDSIEWRAFDTTHEKKLASNAELQLGPTTRLLLERRRRMRERRS